MTTERETNRLPLRAGAMLLLAVAVVFFGLGIHHLTTSGDNDESAPATSAAVSAPVPAPASNTQAAPAASGKVCVVNAGEVSGLAGTVTRTLKEKGFTTAEPANLQSNSLNENTIFYHPGQEAVANEVNTALGGGYSVEQRSAGQTKLPACTGGVLVVAVNQ
ncbi:LytR C-terminal domain-containing protein [Gordonia sp. X0973]|uniref:LytR C-terminal domain-containing protein n=1 Tax=Gordonia sp. X0973 TaxID=2742602 RepID=UPI000F536BA0|nr:LytR C-terminal domain-containing protein [Gordonia sp. X0973]QKT06128.1 LytR C-terminal domain-containing protein [Gordonia sp. X0973]